MNRTVITVQIKAIQWGFSIYGHAPVRKTGEAGSNPVLKKSLNVRSLNISWLCSQNYDEGLTGQLVLLWLATANPESIFSSDNTVTSI